MQNFELPHSKLFWYISELHKQNLIEDHEKQQLKECVIVEQIEIFQALEQYEQNGDEQQFRENLLSLIRQKDLGEIFGLKPNKCTDDEYQFPGKVSQLQPPEF